MTTAAAVKASNEHSHQDRQACAPAPRRVASVRAKSTVRCRWLRPRWRADRSAERRSRRASGAGRRGAARRSAQTSASSSRSLAITRARRDRTPDGDMPRTRPISVASKPATCRSASIARSSGARRRSAIARSNQTRPCSRVAFGRTDVGDLDLDHGMPALPPDELAGFVRSDAHQPWAQALGIPEGAELAPCDRPRRLHRILGEVLVAADDIGKAGHVVVVGGDDPGERIDVAGRGFGHGRRGDPALDRHSGHGVQCVQSSGAKPEAAMVVGDQIVAGLRWMDVVSGEQVSGVSVSPWPLNTGRRSTHPAPCAVATLQIIALKTVSAFAYFSRIMAAFSSLPVKSPDRRRVRVADVPVVIGRDSDRRRFVLPQSCDLVEDRRQVRIDLIGAGREAMIHVRGVARSLEVVRANGDRDHVGVGECSPMLFVMFDAEQQGPAGQAIVGRQVLDDDGLAEGGRRELAVDLDVASAWLIAAKRSRHGVAEADQ